MLTLYVAIRSRFAALTDDRGASMVEYALLVVLIAIIAIVAIRFAGQQVSETFDTIGDSLANTGG
jgi:Flp pilus assembly pilin Flp